jgi:hypothetical protein
MTTEAYRDVGPGRMQNGNLCQLIGACNYIHAIYVNPPSDIHALSFDRRNCIHAGQNFSRTHCLKLGRHQILPRYLIII